VIAEAVEELALALARPQGGDVILEAAIAAGLQAGCAGGNAMHHGNKLAVAGEGVIVQAAARAAGDGARKALIEKMAIGYGHEWICRRAVAGLHPGIVVVAIGTLLHLKAVLLKQA